MSVIGGAIVRGERCQWLEKIADDQTRYISEDVISGAVTPLVSVIYGRSLSAGFAAMAEALKMRVGQMS